MVILTLIFYFSIQSHLGRESFRIVIPVFGAAANPAFVLLIPFGYSWSNNVLILFKFTFTSLSMCFVFSFTCSCKCINQSQDAKNWCLMADLKV